MRTLDMKIRGVVKFKPDHLERGVLQIPFNAQTFDFEGYRNLGERMQEVTENLKQVEEVRLSTTRNPDIRRGDSIVIRTRVEVSDDYLLENAREGTYWAHQIDVSNNKGKILATYFPE